jgi:competence protein ComEC
MTHPDMDHMGGLLSVVQRIPSLRFLWNPVQANVFHLEKILSATQISGARVESVSRESEPIALGCAVLTFLNKAFPSYQDSHSRYNVNNYSVVCRLDHGQSSFLFTGDLQREGEQELLESGLPLKATVLKVAHHAGNTGTTRRFVEAVRPDIAVISAEHPPVRGLPNMDVINRLECAGTSSLWTGRDGAITIESDGVMLRNVALGKRHKSSGEPVF